MNRIIKHGIKFYESICAYGRRKTRKSKKDYKKLEVCYCLISVTSDLPSIFYI
jgi:hypothetical protein